ncbi:hypothetical protein I546_5783 [Mycobacterium kansasii 732]|uniref:DUF1772 domain-containing protein n=1 Tax=Mycobacterium kansasii 662 TaxID=1299326 RepID=X7YZI8_MYCKA|nr:MULTISPECIES: DUF1772 domain-containing protein [Mycobacterium]EUA06123.1 hypothetical protein I546_5783 [Mycobacterium kansasii 732]KZS67508.1 hypothetical protein A4G27_12950 [Mycobacterium kansasii]EUA12617.1 hypothetical protein I545_5150 [Mycobacterium kansasii 662]MBY0390713.1 DUF1772 domain-containing protein [Mycobacterium pseudokansasii]VBA34009.1 hypothetical protein LAUMK35_05633 [Mycobacterium pseudokansasii]
MIELAKMLTVISVLTTAVVYGTDVFCALVQRPALAAVDERALVAVMGHVHRYGDRRMPVPGVLGVVAAIASAALFAVAGQWTPTITVVCAVVILLAWSALYARVSAPINRQLTSAATSGQLPTNARALQSNWDRIINARAILQGVALAALCLTLIV